MEELIEANPEAYDALMAAWDLRVTATMAKGALAAISSAPETGGASLLAYGASLGTGVCLDYLADQVVKYGADKAAINASGGDPELYSSYRKTFDFVGIVVAQHGIRAGLKKITTSGRDGSSSSTSSSSGSSSSSSSSKGKTDGGSSVGKSGSSSSSSSSEARAKRYVISEGKIAYFGKVENQRFHAFRHIEEDSRFPEELAIQEVIKDLRLNVGKLSPDYRGHVKIKGKDLEYRAREIIPGEINIGTMFGEKE
jgi:hypothetical protein